MPFTAALLSLALFAPGEKPAPKPSAKSPLQEAAERVLPKASFGALMDVKTGKLLAIVGEAEMTSQAFPPGSIMKVVTGYAAIKNDMGERYFVCDGAEVHRGVQRACWLRAGHGRLGLRQAISTSCDIYFYRAARLLGPEKLLAAARALGLGEKTGVDLAGESAGQVPDPLPEEKVSQFAVGRMGGLTVTGMQLLSISAAFANGGTLLVPYVGEPKPPRGKIASPEALETLGRALRDAVQSGTGAAASDLPIAGKTGTAPTGQGDATVAWFMGYAPDDAPEVAVVVFISEGLGARDAAAYAADLVRAYFRSRNR